MTGGGAHAAIIVATGATAYDQGQSIALFPRPTLSHPFC